MPKGTRIVTAMISTAGALNRSAIMPCDISLRVVFRLECTAVFLVPHPPAPSPIKREGELR